MSKLKKNIVANFSGSLWQTLMGILFVPIYIKFMGIESWGLVGFFTTLQIMCGILYVGLSNTLNREMSRLSVTPGKEQEMRNLVRTLETVYWSITIAIGVLVTILAPFFANHWINSGELPSKTVEQTLLIMGLVLTLQMPIGFYSGGLMGLQKQVLLNIIKIIVGTLRGVGAAAVLWLISPTIQTFFIWQIIVNLINIICVKFFFQKNIPHSEKAASFEKQLLKRIWKFAAGMTGISISAMILTQLDKIIILKILSLETFGYYTLACVVTSGLTIIITSISNAIFPRFSELVALKNNEKIKNLYHECTQLMSVIILPIAITISFFSYEILLLWTGNSTTAQYVAPILSILILGTTLNALMYLPYTLQLAFGWTKIGLKICLFLIVLLVPTVIILTKIYGVIGAATAWLILNIIYMAIGVPLTHQRLLRGEAGKWFNDILYPLLSTLIIIIAGYCLLNIIKTPFMIFILIFGTLLCAMLGASMSSTYTRNIILKSKTFRRISLC